MFGGGAVSLRHGTAAMTRMMAARSTGSGSDNSPRTARYTSDAIITTASQNMDRHLPDLQRSLLEPLRVGHDHSTEAGGTLPDFGCSESVTLRRQGSAGRIRIAFRSGPDRLVSDGCPSVGRCYPGNQELYAWRGDSTCGDI